MKISRLRYGKLWGMRAGHSIHKYQGQLNAPGWFGSDHTAYIVIVIRNKRGVAGPRLAGDINISIPCKTAVLSA